MAWPVYDWMGVAKAGLESASRYLARYLGAQGIRSNLVSAGPLRTMAAKSIPGFEQFEEAWAERAPLGWDLTDTEPAAQGRAARCCPTGSRPPPARSSTSTAATTRSAPEPALERSREPSGRFSRPVSDGSAVMAYDAFLLLSLRRPGAPRRRAAVPAERDPRPRRAAASGWPRSPSTTSTSAACRRSTSSAASCSPRSGPTSPPTAIDLPMYWGNRNWQPMLADTLAQMRDDGVAARARASRPAPTGRTPRAGSTWRTSPRPGPRSARAPRWSTSCGTSTTTRASSSRSPTRSRAALAELDAARRDSTRLVFTAHSIPVSMAEPPGPDGGRYEAQLRETAAAGRRRAPRRTWPGTWSGRAAPARRRCRGWSRTSTTTCERSPRRASTQVVVSPIGFVSDHLEVIWDLDNEAAATAAQLGLGFARAGTPGHRPAVRGDGPRAGRWSGCAPSGDRARPRSVGSITGTSAPSHCCPAPPRSAATAEGDTR